jgi:hypothetical protein
MLVEAESKGLLLHPDKVKSVLCYSHPDSRYAPDPITDLNISLRGASWILEHLPQKFYNFETRKYNWSVPRGSTRSLPPGLRIHKTVRLRWEKRTDYRPQNLPNLPPKETDEPWVRYPAK